MRPAAPRPRRGPAADLLVAACVSLLGGAPAARAAPPDACRGRAVVEFCKAKLPLGTTRVTCYEGRGIGSGAPVMDLTPLTCLPALTELELASGEIELILTLRIRDVAPLGRLRRLTRLELQETDVADVAPLAPLTGLQVLSLHASPVTDVRPLAGMEQLRRLDLSCTRVSGLAPLRSLRRLEHLDQTNAPVRDLEPILDLPGLQWLGLSQDAKVPPAQLAALKRRRPELRITEGRRY